MVTSLSPFALGYATVTAGAFRVKQVKLHHKQRPGKRTDAWSFYGAIDAGNTTANALIFNSIATTGADFNNYGRGGLIDSVAFGAQNCGVRRHTKKPVLVCSKDRSSRVVIKSHSVDWKSKLLVEAQFEHRAFNISVPLEALAPLEVQIATSSSLGTLTALATRCKASARKLRCETLKLGR